MVSDFLKSLHFYVEDAEGDSVKRRGRAGKAGKSEQDRGGVSRSC